MRPSSLRHTLAVLRITIGLTQKELANILKCSAPTIQAIELGRLKLSEGLAFKVSQETGCSLQWLLDNDVSKPPVRVFDERPLMKETFESIQGRGEDKQSPSSTKKALAAMEQIEDLREAKLLEVLFEKANEIGKRELLRYRFSKFVEKFTEEFGIDISKDRRKIDQIDKRIASKKLTRVPL